MDPIEDLSVLGSPKKCCNDSRDSMNLHFDQIDGFIRCIKKTFFFPRIYTKSFSVFSSKIVSLEVNFEDVVKNFAQGLECQNLLPINLYDLKNS